MKPLSLNMSKVKKVGGDEDHTMFKHDDGHTIRIEHALLPSLQKKQLQQLPIQKMADGGVAYMQDGGLPSANIGGATRQSLQNYFNPNQPQAAAPGPDIQKSVNERLNQLNAVKENLRPLNNNEQAEYNTLKAKQSMQQAPAASSNSDANQFATNAEAFGGKIQKYAGTDDPADSEVEADDDSSAAADPKAATPAGASDTWDEESTPQGQAAQAGVPSATTGGPLPGGSPGQANPVAQSINLNDAFQQGTEAIKQKANVEAQLSQQRAKIESEDLASRQSLMDDAKQNAQDFQTHQKQFMQDYMNGHIDPKHYQENQSGGQKVATAIGLFLGGLSTPFTHQGNPALDFLNKQIDRDIEGQKERIGQGKTLLEANQNLYHDQQLADNATRMNMNDIYSHQIAQAADALGTPAAEANKNAALSQFSLQNANLLQQNAMRAAVLRGGPNVPLSSKIQYGLPQDQQAEAQKQASEYDSYVRAKQNVNTLMDQLDKEQSASNLGNPQSYARANQIKAQIVQAVMETSPSKRLTKESIENEIAPLMYSTGASPKTRSGAKQAINQLVDVHAGPMNILSDNGFIPKVGSQNKPPASQDQQALAWANANPKDPRAMQIKKRLGGQ